MIFLGLQNSKLVGMALWKDLKYPLAQEDSEGGFHLEADFW